VAGEASNEGGRTGSNSRDLPRGRSPEESGRPHIPPSTLPECRCRRRCCGFSPPRISRCRRLSGCSRRRSIRRCARRDRSRRPRIAAEFEGRSLSTQKAPAGRTRTCDPRLRRQILRFFDSARFRLFRHPRRFSELWKAVETSGYFGAQVLQNHLQRMARQRGVPRAGDARHCRHEGRASSDSTRRRHLTRHLIVGTDVNSLGGAPCTENPARPIRAAA
jgi:hypothetical protein